jgi:hypothetical protein
LGWRHKSNAHPQPTMRDVAQEQSEAGPARGGDFRDLFARALH